MAKNTGGQIDLGTVSKNMRYIEAGGYYSWERVPKQKSKKFQGNLILTVTYNRKKDTLQLAVEGKQTAGVRIFYNLKNGNKAIEFDKPLSFSSSKDKRIYVWLMKESTVLQRYYVDVLSQSNIVINVCSKSSSTPFPDLEKLKLRYKNDSNTTNMDPFISLKEINLNVNYLEDKKAFSMKTEGYDDKIVLLYSLRKNINNAMEYRAPISEKYVDSKFLFIWVCDGNQQLLAKFYALFKSPKVVDIVKVDGSFPSKIDNYAFRGPFKPKYLVQDLSKVIKKKELKFITEENQYLFRPQFMEKLMVEIRQPSNCKFNIMLEEMRVSEIINMIDAFNNLKLHCKGKKDKYIVAPKRWLWSYVEYDKEHLASFGFWFYLVNEDQLKIRLQTVHLDYLHNEEIQDFYGEDWDDHFTWDDDSDDRAFIYCSNKNHKLPNDLYFDNRGNKVDKYQRKIEEIYLTYLKGHHVDVMDLNREIRRVATNCATVMRLLLEENGLNLDKVLDQIKDIG